MRRDYRKGDFIRGGIPGEREAARREPGFMISVQRSPGDKHARVQLLKEFPHRLAELNEKHDAFVAEAKRQLDLVQAGIDVVKKIRRVR